MNILIIGKKDSGKTMLGHRLKNYIFRVDGGSHIVINDAGDTSNTIGHGNREYKIRITQIPTKEEIETADIIVDIKTEAFASRIKEL